MGFFSDMTEEDFMEAPKEVPPVVLNTAADVDVVENTGNEDAVDIEIEYGGDEDIELEPSDYEDDDDDILGEVESAGVVNVPEEKVAEVPVEKKSAKKSEQEATSGPTSSDITHIGKTCTIEGSVTCHGDCSVFGTVNGKVVSNKLEVAVDGFVGEGVEATGDVSVYGKVFGGIKAKNVSLFQSKTNGDVSATEKVSVFEGAVLVGDVSASSATISGAIKGNIDVQGPVSITKSAVVKGNIKAEHINIEPGAKVAGSVELCYGESVNITDDIFE